METIMPASHVRGILLSFFTLLAAAVQGAADISVAELRCNHTLNPMGIDDLAPRLSWKLVSAKRGAVQTAYHILVGTAAEFSERDAVWNTGKVASSQSVNVAYAGKTLQYGVRYYWKVKVWDGAGNASDFSAAGYWEMALDPQGWAADWISAPVIFDLQALNRHRYAMIRGAKNDYLEPMPLLRKRFAASKPIAQARLYVAGLGFHEVYLNGHRVSDDVLSPAFTHYDKTVLFLYTMQRPGCSRVPTPWALCWATDGTTPYRRKYGALIRPPGVTTRRFACNW